MTLQEIYDLSVQMGIKADPRGEAEVKRILAKLKKEYNELPEKKKKYFDKESFVNPYSDTRLFWGDPKTSVKRALVGIDADATEVLLADRLTQKGTKIDVVIGHHPIGISLLALNEVMDLQVNAYADMGVPINVMDALMRERSDDVKRKIHPSNHNQIIDTARLLDIPLMNLHTVWDNISDKFMTEYLKKRKFDTVEEIVDYIMELPEYEEAKMGKNGPEIVSGTGKSRAGKVAIFFTGGTNPSKEIYAELAKAGVGTLVDMHIPEEALKELKKLHVNVINAGHMASDSIGANIFLDEIERKGVEVIAASGLIRVKRKK
ncbi:MAG: NIF3 (NGG1p interacting factor 3)-like protein [Microgenomates group bacterium GW2011_GWA2_37_6]|nr:MAG: NIF3 (NGG1p interacting factor 3)-like protein [Microgenomates group bacterium GW2011_GWA2_37_6]